MFLFLNLSPSLLKAGHRLPVIFFPLFFHAHVQSIPYQAQWIRSHSYESTAVKPYIEYMANFPHHTQAVILF